MLAESAQPQWIASSLSCFCLLWKKETFSWDTYRCVITWHVCTALTNFLLDWAAETPARQRTSWCDRPIIIQDYPALTSLCFFTLSFPGVREETVANAAWWQGTSAQVEDTVNGSYGAACHVIIQTVPYCSVFQQLVICLISVLENNGMIITTKTDTHTGGRGQRGRFVNETFFH